MTLTSNRKNIALIVLCIVLFVIAVADTVLNLALPSISGNLNATSSQMLWIVDIYLLVVATLQIAFGSIGDHFGRKRLLQIGLIIFGIGSLGSAFSNTSILLIFFRTITGLGAAIMMPSTLSILTDVFREPKERAKAIATWSSVFSIGAGFGPIIAGYLLETFNWTAVFYLNIPIVIVGLIGSYFFLPESSGNHGAKLNYASICLSAAGLVAFVYALITGGEYGWLSFDVLVSFALSVVMIIGFVLCEKRSKNNMFPLSFFRNMTFSGSNISLTICTFAMMGSFYFFSQYFQSIQGFSALQTGLAMLPLNVFVFIFTFMSVPLDRKIGTKATVSLGLIAMGLGLLLFSYTADVTTSYALSFTVLFLIAVGLGFVMSPSTNAIMNSIPSTHAGIGSAMNDTTRQIGGALGIAVLGSLMNSRYIATIDASTTINSLLGETAVQIRKSLQSALLTANQLPDQTATQVIEIAKSAFVTGLHEAVFIGAIIMFVSAAAAVVLIPKRTKRAVEPDRAASSVIVEA
jgi:EmrB/QacA subfamily drug resistance transporter